MYPKYHSSFIIHSGSGDTGRLLVVSSLTVVGLTGANQRGSLLSILLLKVTTPDTALTPWLDIRFTRYFNTFRSVAYSLTIELGQVLGEKSLTTMIRLDILRDLGACLAPQSAWLLIQGRK